MSASKSTMACTLLAALLVFAGIASAESPNIDTKADKLLQAMSSKLAGAKQMRLSMKRTIEADLIEDSDEFETVQGRVLVARPNKLVAEITTKGHRRRLVCDGMRVSLLDMEANCYATAPAAGNIDSALEMLDEDYGYAPPLADFLVSDPYENFMRQIRDGAKEFKSGKYAGLVTVSGKKFHRLAFREKYVHWDLWIDVETTLPRRFVVTATGIKGDPKLVLEFLAIDLSPEFDEMAFAFKVPAGAKQVPMPKVQPESAGKPKAAANSSIPSDITTPDKVETSIGTLEFLDGAPTVATAATVYDYLDTARAMDTFLKGQPACSINAIIDGLHSLGAVEAHEVVIFDKLMNSKSLFLTANTSTLYAFPVLDLKRDGPTVVEVPDKLLGAANDSYFRYVNDLMKAGKYLYLPPGYKGEVPNDYTIVKPKTYRLWIFLRASIADGVDKAAEFVKGSLKVYPLAKADSPPAMKFVSASGKSFNTIHPNNIKFYHHLDKIIQYEPLGMLDPETRGLFASIGIEKGKKFAPDARMERILADGVALGNAASRSVVWYPRYDKNMKGVRIYPDTNSAWIMAFTGRNVFFNGKDGMTMNSDARVMFYYPYTAVTPAMSTPKEGRGSDYGIAYVDSKKQPFDGCKTYKLHIPAKPPVKSFWAATIYDTQTRSMLQTSELFPTVGSQTKGIRKNGDGSTTIYFGPKAPKGYENNWLETIPGKSWFVILRMYGPLKPWLDQTWRPGEIELIESGAE